MTLARRAIPAILIFLFCMVPTVYSSSLGEKADDYQANLTANHRPGLGAVLTVEYEEDERINVDCYHYQGDSTIWTGMYLGSQALRYIITEEAGANDQMMEVVEYFKNAMDITDTPGYIGRFAGPDVFPFVCSKEKYGPYGGKGPEKVLGTGDWAGYYWYDETSRDQYSGYIWGMGWAYDTVDDEATREIIRTDLEEVMVMLADNQWHITDQNGQWTGNGAHWIGPTFRLAFILVIAHVLDKAEYWELLDQQYELLKPLLWIDTFSFYNRYKEYYGNNLRHLAFQSIFRLWPDRKRLMEIWDIWQSANRPWVEFTYNPWFDAVHITGCRRLGLCDEDEVADIVADYELILGQYWDPPSYRRGISCSDMPLDPISTNPFFQSVFGFTPQTQSPRELNDRHWTDMYWQSGGVFEASCETSENRKFVGPGWDYILAYYLGVYHGILPGNGPWNDPGFVDDPDDDDDDDDDNDDDFQDDDVAEDDDDSAGDDDDSIPKESSEKKEEGCCG